MPTSWFGYVDDDDTDDKNKTNSNNNNNQPFWKNPRTVTKSYRDDHDNDDNDYDCAATQTCGGEETFEGDFYSNHPNGNHFAVPQQQQQQPAVIAMEDAFVDALADFVVSAFFLDNDDDEHEYKNNNNDDDDRHTNKSKQQRDGNGNHYDSHSQGPFQQRKRKMTKKKQDLTTHVMTTAATTATEPTATATMSNSPPDLLSPLPEHKHNDPQLIPLEEDLTFRPVQPPPISTVVPSSTPSSKPLDAMDRSTSFARSKIPTVDASPLPRSLVRGQSDTKASSSTVVLSVGRGTGKSTHDTQHAPTASLVSPRTDEAPDKCIMNPNTAAAVTIAPAPVSTTTAWNPIIDCANETTIIPPITSASLVPSVPSHAISSRSWTLLRRPPPPPNRAHAHLLPLPTLSSSSSSQQQPPPPQQQVSIKNGGRDTDNDKVTISSDNFADFASLVSSQQSNPDTFGNTGGHAAMADPVAAAASTPLTSSNPTTRAASDATGHGNAPSVDMMAMIMTTTSTSNTGAMNTWSNDDDDEFTEFFTATVVTDPQSIPVQGKETAETQSKSTNKESFESPAAVIPRLPPPPTYHTTMAGLDNPTLPETNGNDPFRNHSLPSTVPNNIPPGASWSGLYLFETNTDSFAFAMPKKDPTMVVPQHGGPSSSVASQMTDPATQVSVENHHDDQDHDFGDFVEATIPSSFNNNEDDDREASQGAPSLRIAPLSETQKLFTTLTNTDFVVSAPSPNRFSFYQASSAEVAMTTTSLDNETKMDGKSADSCAMNNLIIHCDKVSSSDLPNSNRKGAFTNECLQESTSSSIPSVALAPAPIEILTDLSGLRRNSTLSNETLSSETRPENEIDSSSQIISLQEQIAGEVRLRKEAVENTRIETERRVRQQMETSVAGLHNQLARELEQRQTLLEETQSRTEQKIKDEANALLQLQGIQHKEEIKRVVSQWEARLTQAMENANGIAQTQLETEGERIASLERELQKERQSHQAEIQAMKQELNLTVSRMSGQTSELLYRLERTQNELEAEKLKYESETCRLSLEISDLKQSFSGQTKQWEDSLEKANKAGAMWHAKFVHFKKTTEPSKQKLERQVQESRRTIQELRASESKLCLQIRQLETQLQASADSLAAACSAEDAMETVLAEQKKSFDELKREMERGAEEEQKCWQQKVERLQSSLLEMERARDEAKSSALAERERIKALSFQEITLQQGLRKAQRLATERQKELQSRDALIEQLRADLGARDKALSLSQEKQKNDDDDDDCNDQRKASSKHAKDFSHEPPLNVTYLKEVVVKYLSLPSGSSELSHLLPVLATLLKFDEQDFQTIQDGKQRSTWW